MQNSTKNSVENRNEDFETVQQILAGDKSAFMIFQKKYKGIVTSLIRKMIKNDEDVQDLVQETFIKAYNALSSFQNGFSFSAWLYRIASNNCIDFLRKKRFNTVSITKFSTDSQEDEDIDIEDSSYSADSGLLNTEKYAVLHEAIQKLPENYRIIIKLRHEDELDYNEIAEQLNIPLGTVKAHLFRARKILYDYLKNKQYLFLEN